jgi:hypothetical protein
MGYKRRFVKFCADRRTCTVNLSVTDRSDPLPALEAPQKVALAKAEGKAGSVSAALAKLQNKGITTRSTSTKTAYRGQQHS